MHRVRSIVLILATLVLAFCVGDLALAAPQTTCPVLGNPVNKDIHVDYQGKRIYFCCPPCADTFKKDPEKYLQVLRQAGQEPEAAPGAEAKGSGK